MSVLWPNPQRVKELLREIDEQARRDTRKLTDSLRAALAADDRERERSH